MKAVIMAGGEGTRLRPLTCNLPKPMVPILNRPMMEHIINLLKSHEITEIANTLWYLPRDVTDYFGDGSRFGVSMNYYVEEEPLGTAGSVKNAEQFLDETFVVVSGDSLTDIDLTKAVEFHKKRNAVATLVLTRVSNPLSYGVVITDDEGRIVQFLEKPSWSEVFSDTVNTGIYVLEPEVLNEFSQGQNFDFSKDLFPKLLEKGAPIYGYVADGYWSDVGSLDVYHRAQQDCLDGKVAIKMPRPVSEGVYVEEGAVIEDNVRIKGPVYIGKGARVESGAYLGPYSVVGPYAQIEEGTSIKRSTLWSGVQVGPQCELRGCVLAKNVKLQQKVQVYEGAIIGEQTEVGSESTISPNTKIWPQKWIPSGSTLKQSLVWGSQERPSLFTKTGISGDIRGQLTPESIVKAGLSYAAFLGQGNNVLVTADPINVARVAKRALISGLLSGGINVLDGGTVMGNLTRFGAQIFNVSGALHCEGIPGHKNSVNIQTWDGNGRYLKKGDQRKIENMFLREDFPRANGNELGKLSFVKGLSERYLDMLAKAYRSAVSGFRVRLATTSEKVRTLGFLVRNFLERAGYTVVDSDERGVIRIVVGDGEWYFEDEEGKRVDENAWWNIFAKALGARSREAIAVPVHVSDSIPQTAEETGLNVRWTRLEPQFWMEAASELGNTEGQSVDGEDVEVFPYIEPVASIGEVLRYITSTQEKLTSLARSSTKHTRTGRVLCPWKDKGRVMRELIGATHPDNTLYLDGIKEYSHSGWALVVPDGDEPVFQIYSEANTQEEADGLVEHYSNMINSHISEER